MYIDIYDSLDTKAPLQFNSALIFFCTCILEMLRKYYFLSLLHLIIHGPLHYTLLSNKGLHNFNVAHELLRERSLFMAGGEGGEPVRGG